MASPRKRRERKAAALAAQETSETLETEEELPGIVESVLAEAKKAAVAILESDPLDLEEEELTYTPKKKKKKAGKGRVNLFGSKDD